MATELPFEYSVVRSRRKSIAVYIRAGHAEVRAPLRAPNTFILAFLQEKSDWIRKQLHEENSRSEQRYRLNDGCTLSFLGEPLTVHYHPEKTLFQNNRLLLQQGVDEHATLINFDSWLKQQADEVMTPLAVEIAAEIGSSNKLLRVRYRKTKTNWGHCTSKGILQFNPLAMLAPFEVVAYLVCHEACHLQQMNHSSRFWSLVESVCPDYKKSRQWLKSHGDILMGLHSAH